MKASEQPDNLGRQKCYCTTWFLLILFVLLLMGRLQCRAKVLMCRRLNFLISEKIAVNSSFSRQPCSQ